MPKFAHFGEYFGVRMYALDGTCLISYTVQPYSMNITANKLIYMYMQPVLCNEIAHWFDAHTPWNIKKRNY